MVMEESTIVGVGEEIAIISVGIAAIFYAYTLSEYFEKEVEKAKERLKVLKEQEQSDLVSIAIEAQKWVFHCFTGKWKRFVLVWLPTIMLFGILVALLLLEYWFNSYIPRYIKWLMVSYFVSLFIPTMGAAIGMLKRPVSTYQEATCRKL